ncbi:hypothetical protein KAR91_63715, partial [Candidatus Pacearchaeota archaeon]|nr:hypothetical protein [Candidatus Pacearchaeota archaeon]
GGLCGWVHTEYLGDYPIGLPPVDTPVIKNCYSTVNVTLNHPNNMIGSYSIGSAGGLCGYAEGAELLNNYACGSVDATGTDTPFGFDVVIDNGGLVGNIKNCNVYNNYSSGYVVDGRAYSNPGGFCGSIFDDQTIFFGNFWDNTVNPSLQGIGNAADSNVTGKSTMTMQTESTFTDVGWDFVDESVNGTEDIWRMCLGGSDLPRLNWQFTSGDYVCPLGDLEVDLALDNLWMYQNLPGQNKSRVAADALVIDDPLSNASYSYDWQIILPSDVSVTLVTVSGGGTGDESCTLAAPPCDQPGGLSGLGETFTVEVTVTGEDYGNSGSAQVQFGIALLGDVNNDAVINVADRGITNAFWRSGAAGNFTLTDCDVNCDGVVNVADRGITNAIWRGLLGSNSAPSPCPLRQSL